MIQAQSGIAVGSLSGVGSSYIGVPTGVGVSALPMQDCSLICEGIITSKEQKSQEFYELKVFPNPTSNFVSFTFSGENSVPANARITTIQGQQVINEQLNQPFDQVHNLTINKRVKPGVYILQVKQGEVTFSERLVIIP